jgi:hypothetical protein
MAVRLYRDVHIPMAITRQLRLREVDVATATEEGTNELDDDILLELAGEQGRVLFTHDIRFKALAENWQRADKSLPVSSTAMPKAHRSANMCETWNLSPKHASYQNWQTR